MRVTRLALGVCHAALCCSVAWAAPENRTLTFAEVKSLTVTTPVLHVVGGTPTATSRSWLGRYTAWAEYGDGRWTTVFASSNVAADAPNGKPVEFFILLERMPRSVRIGATGYYTGPLFVDHIELVFPDGTRMNPVRVEAVNTAHNLPSAIGADGKLASISHTAPPNPALPTVVDGIDAVFDGPPRKWQDARLSLPAVPAPPVRLGVYHYPSTDADPHETLRRKLIGTESSATVESDLVLHRAALF